MVLNLTAVATAAPGYFTLYPSGVARPTASSINFPKGWTGANMVTVPVGADGKVALYNSAGRHTPSSTCSGGTGATPTSPWAASSSPR